MRWCFFRGTENALNSNQEFIGAIYSMIFRRLNAYPSCARESKAFLEIDLPEDLNITVMSRDDYADAVVCAIVGLCYAATVGIVRGTFPKVYLPKQPLMSEGWIFSPEN